MADMHVSTGSAERRKDFYKGKPDNTAAEYQEELRAAKTRTEAWHKRADKVVDRYDNAKRDTNGGVQRNYNIFWSNTEILKGAVYSASAKPDIRRRFPDRSNPAARTAAEVLERAVQYNCEEYDFDNTVESAVHDSLVPGHGIARVRFEQAIDDDTDDVYDQHLETDWVHWKDFRWSAARAWSDVYWVAFRHTMTRDQLIREFPEDGKKIPLNTTVDGGTKKRSDTRKDEDSPLARADIWEVWDKRTRERLYVSENYPTILQRDEDPYQLRNFFPCGEPLANNRESGALIPVPEYTYYQDQAQEVDLATSRIAKLTGYLKHVGVYDATDNDIAAALKDLPGSVDGTFKPVKNLSTTLQQAGGAGSLGGVLVAMEIGPISQVIQELMANRAQAIQGIYEVTGISDVIRGSSDPNETATAQRIKGQFGSMRLQRRQGKVQRWIRDIFRIKTEIIAEWFEPQMLADITGVQLPFEKDVAEAEEEIGRLEGELDQLNMMMQQQEAAAPGVMNGGPPGMPPQMGPGGPPMPPPMPPQGPQGMPQDMMAPEGGPAPEEDAPDENEESREEIEGQIAEQQEIIDGVTWPKVMEILRSDDRRAYAIDVQTDSTIQPDEAADMEQRNTFLATFQGLMETVIGAAETSPGMIPLLKELTLFSMRGHKIGRTMEEAVEDAFEDLEEMSSEQEDQPEPEPDPAMLELQLKKATLEQKARMDETSLEIEAKKALAADEVTRLKMKADQDKDVATFNADQEKDKRDSAIAGQKLMLEERKQTLAENEHEFEKIRYAQDRMDSGVPEQTETAGLVAAIGEQSAQAASASATIAQVVSNMSAMTQQLNGAVEAMAAQAAAPVSIVKENGQIQGVNKGGVFRPASRDPETGEINGLQ